MSDQHMEHAVRPPWYGTDIHHCFGCAPDNPAGLALDMAASGDSLVCSFTLTRLHESYPGMVHGGVSAAILDELMGNVLIHHERKACFLTDLRVRYAGALRIGRRYSAAARVSDRPGDSIDIIRLTAEIHDADGQVLVSARGTFQWMTADQWRRALGPNCEPDPSLHAFLRASDTEAQAPSDPCSHP